MTGLQFDACICSRSSEQTWKLIKNTKPCKSGMKHNMLWVMIMRALRQSVMCIHEIDLYDLVGFMLFLSLSLPTTTPYLVFLGLAQFPNRAYVHVLNVYIYIYRRQIGI